MFATMIAAFALGCLSLALRKDKLLGSLTVFLVLAASLWGSLPRMGDLAGGHHIYFGLDFFILNAAFGGILFIPLERIFPHNPQQGVFRGWSSFSPSPHWHHQQRSSQRVSSMEFALG
jgi:hypothetical protein